MYAPHSVVGIGYEGQDERLSLRSLESGKWMPTTIKQLQYSVRRTAIVLITRILRASGKSSVLVISGIH